jgi:hypothetical protein
MVTTDRRMAGAAGSAWLGDVRKFTMGLSPARLAWADIGRSWQTASPDEYDVQPTIAVDCAIDT